MRAVARRAGVSAGAPYHHFQDKDALLAAVARDGFDELLQVQLAVLDLSGSAADRLEHLVKEYVLFAVRHRTHYDLMFRTLPSDVGGAEGAALQEAAVSAFSHLVEAFRAVKPTLTEGEVTQRALLGWAFAHGAVDICQWGVPLQSGFNAEEFAADVGREVKRSALR